MKNPPEVNEAREAAILKCLLDGLSTRDIAISVGLSDASVYSIIASMCDKHGVANRIQLAVRVWSVGLENIGRSV